MRPKGPVVLPARPSGPGRIDHDMCRPNGPTIPLDARAVLGTLGPLGRLGCWWQSPGPLTLAGRTAGPLGRTTDHLDIEGADVKEDRSIVLPPGETNGVLVVCAGRTIANSNHPARRDAVKSGPAFRNTSDPTDLVSVVKKVCG